jgi:hypothetical protein
MSVVTHYCQKHLGVPLDFCWEVPVSDLCIQYNKIVYGVCFFKNIIAICSSQAWEAPLP